MANLNFCSENYAGAHPEMMKAIMAANVSHVPSYGQDDWTKEAIKLLKQEFGEEIDVYFVFNGTGANNFGLGAATQRWHGIYCSDVAHLYVDESTAPETFTGCRLYPVMSVNGKVIARELEAAISRQGDLHHPQPGAVSITQPTEYGTVYTLTELEAIKAICHKHNLLLHIDGARYFNAAAALNVDLAELVTSAGADILTLGGTKAGMLFGEAVIFFKLDDKAGRRYHLKRSMQLASKQRFIAAQFGVMLKDELWRAIATHTDQLAKTFETLIADMPGVQLSRPVETNMVFLKMDKQRYEELQQKARFYYWNDADEEVRLVFSFDHTVEDVKALVNILSQ